MRWLISTFLIALGIFALVNAGQRVGDLLFNPLPQPAQLQSTDTVLEQLQSVQYCKNQRRGGQICRWAIQLLTRDGASWELHHLPLDERYVLLQPGDRLRLGVYRNTIYTLERVAAQRPVNGLEQHAVLLDGPGFGQWRQAWTLQQLGWIALELSLFALACWTGFRLPSTSSPRVLFMMFCISSFSWLAYGRSEPAPLPVETELSDISISHAAVVERLQCPLIWFAWKRCEPRMVILDAHGKTWPLAYEEVALRPAQRGDQLLLGTYAGSVYRVRHAPPDDAAPGCSYRQNPLSRRTQVTWSCDDVRAVARARNPLGEAQRQLALSNEAFRHSLPLLSFGQSERAFREASVRHDRSLAAIFLGPGMFFLCIYLDALFRRRS